MRIVNFNTTINLWKSWKKNYIDDLNIKITSLWNHMMFQNPPFRVLNSINQENPVDLDSEEFPYRIMAKRVVGLEEEDPTTEDIHIFLPARLQFHQGFYNDSPYGDAVLGYYTKDITTDNKHPNICLFQEEEEKNGKEPIKIIYNDSEGYYSIQWNQDIEYDFPSGHICVSNVQPDGANNELNEKRHVISSYLIYPLGNGSYFDLSAHGNTWTAQYQQNDMENYADRMVINLSSALRYIITAENDIAANTGTWSSYNIGVTQKNAEYSSYIQDINGNIWTGKEDLVLEIYDSDNELVICDTQTQITKEVQSQTITHRVLLTTNIKSDGYKVHSI